MRRDDWQEKLLMAFLIAIILASIFGAIWAIRAHAPCSMFPLAEAPVRCLPGTTP